MYTLIEDRTAQVTTHTYKREHKILRIYKRSAAPILCIRPSTLYRPTAIQILLQASAYYKRGGGRQQSYNVAIGYIVAVPQFVSSVMKYSRLSFSSCVRDARTYCWRSQGPEVGAFFFNRIKRNAQSDVRCNETVKKCVCILYATVECCWCRQLRGGRFSFLNW